jgi:hypothetical protein
VRRLQYVFFVSSLPFSPQPAPTPSPTSSPTSKALLCKDYNMFFPINKRHFSPRRSAVFDIDLYLGTIPSQEIVLSPQKVQFHFAAANKCYEDN